MVDSAFRPVRIMLLENAWPSKWQFPAMDASAEGPATELIMFEADRIVELAP